MRQLLRWSLTQEPTFWWPGRRFLVTAKRGARAASETGSGSDATVNERTESQRYSETYLAIVHLLNDAMSLT